MIFPFDDRTVRLIDPVVRNALTLQPCSDFQDVLRRPHTVLERPVPGNVAQKRGDFIPERKQGFGELHEC